MVDKKRSSKCVLGEEFLLSYTRKMSDGYSLELLPIRMIQTSTTQNVNLSVMLALKLTKASVVGIRDRFR